VSIFEAVMLICFGAAWPFSIYKSYMSGSNFGKSVGFLWVVLAGYIAGIIHKVIYSFDIVIVFYILNFIMVSADIALFYKNAKEVISEH
jgi:hypothetical protein